MGCGSTSDRWSKWTDCSIHENRTNCIGYGLVLRHAIVVVVALMMDDCLYSDSFLFSTHFPLYALRGFLSYFLGAGLDGCTFLCSFFSYLDRYIWYYSWYTQVVHTTHPINHANEILITRHAIYRRLHRSFPRRLQSQSATIFNLRWDFELTSMGRNIIMKAVTVSNAAETKTELYYNQSWVLVPS